MKQQQLTQSKQPVRLNHPLPATFLPLLRVLLPMLLCFSAYSTDSNASTAVAIHGNLAVKGKQIVNQQGDAVTFAGVSLFWSNNGWGGERFYNANTVAQLQKNWNATIIRAAVGAEGPGSYLEYPEDHLSKLDAVVKAAIAEGVYVIVDWHSHSAEKGLEQAIIFFETVAEKYGRSPNIIYEIYNEPLNNTDWSTVIKPYAEKVIAAIRKIDQDNLIIVGTQTWSQDVDKAAEDPITGYDNIAYTLHFYAGTHKQALRDKAEAALQKGIALMVTEWGSVNADGDGAVAKEETARWMKFLRKHKISHLNWSLNDKKEGASVLQTGTPPDGIWTDNDLTESGLVVKQIVSRWDTRDYQGREAN